MELFWSLPSVTLIAGAADRSIEMLFAGSPVRSYGEGARLSDPDARPERTFLCLSGTLKVTKLLASGREILITILQAGSVWSDRAVLNGYWRDVFIETMDQSDIVTIENSAFEDFIRSRPELVSSFMVRISEQVSDALTLLDDFRGRDVASRLASVLIRFSKQYGVPTDNGVRIDLPVTHQDLANMIGTARETVSRNMGRFRKKGMVREAEGHALEIVNIGGLESLIV